jgi:tetratricopeptide (TPR) repeat protein
VRDLKYVLGKVIIGEFNPSVQLRVIPMRKELQRAMQLARYADVKRIAGEILAIDAADELAVRVSLFLYERNKRMKETPAFLDSLLLRSPKTPFLHLLKLDALNLTNASPQDLRIAAETALVVFTDNHAALNRLASLLVNRLRFGTAPLDVALKASQKAVDLFFAGNKLNSERLANYLETRAKVYYLTGKFTDAVESQEKAANLMKGDSSEKRARILIDYYKSAETLSKQ